MTQVTASVSKQQTAPCSGRKSKMFLTRQQRKWLTGRPAGRPAGRLKFVVLATLTLTLTPAHTRSVPEDRTLRARKWRRSLLPPSSEMSIFGVPNQQCCHFNINVCYKLLWQCFIMIGLLFNLFILRERQHLKKTSLHRGITKQYHVGKILARNPLKTPFRKI